MKIVTVIGARPQFIKAAALSRCITQNHSENIQEVLVHTGQHYDPNMSEVFFDELGIPAPKYNLGISGGLHGEMTGRMLEGLEKIFCQEQPDLVLVYGDTNSTLAAALAAGKMHLPIAHVEAGLRSFNMRMPEEINRILTDRISNFLFCPTQTALDNLYREGMESGIHLVGDVMYDAALFYADKAMQQSSILEKLGVKPREFIFVTCHRAENTDNPQRLTNILNALAEISKQTTVVFPVHPRTKNYIERYDLEDKLSNLQVLGPLPYLDTIALEKTAKAIVTDSGGIQKEAFFYNVPCITMRDETEWVETVELGWNTIVGAEQESIYKSVLEAKSGVSDVLPYGDGNASEKILGILLEKN